MKLMRMMEQEDPREDNMHVKAPPLLSTGSS